MDPDAPPRHLLDGFPDAVLHFIRAMEGNRREVASSHGMTEIEIRALFRIAEAGNIVPKDLAGDLSVTTGAITGIADRLVGAGFVKRATHPGDRRSLYLGLTDTGHAAMKAMHLEFIALLLQATEMVGADQLESARTTLNAVAHNVNAKRTRPSAASAQAGNP